MDRLRTAPGWGRPNLRTGRKVALRIRYKTLADGVLLLRKRCTIVDNVKEKNVAALPGILSHCVNSHAIHLHRARIIVLCVLRHCCNV